MAILSLWRKSYFSQGLFLGISIRFFFFEWVLQFGFFFSYGRVLLLISSILVWLIFSSHSFLSIDNISLVLIFLLGFLFFVFDNNFSFLLLSPPFFFTFVFFFQFFIILVGFFLVIFFCGILLPQGGIVRDFDIILEFFSFFPRLVYLFSLDIFHNSLTCFLLFFPGVVITLLWMLLKSFFFFKVNKSYNQSLEIFRVCLSLFFIVILMVRTLYIFYSYSISEDQVGIFLKVVGHQWYWHYELCGFDFDSFFSHLDDFYNLVFFRNLEALPRLYLPIGGSINLSLTSYDVIHSWSVPSLGVKIDCTPGILCYFLFKVPFIGVFYGQCAELCGTSHSFIPITLESRTFYSFMHSLMFSF